jgi:hypothetical protein
VHAAQQATGHSKQRSLEPVATGTGFLDKEKMLGFGLPLADEVINVTADFAGLTVENCFA